MQSLSQEAVTAQPHVGDTVHIAANGPASVTKADDGSYEVEYPSGDKATVERSQILSVEAARKGKVKQTGPAGMEYLGRAFDDPSRAGTTASATFSLTATLIGGGILSLPYAMSQCGVVFGTAVLILSALLTGWSLDMLVDCARATGRDTYEMVGHAAFGQRARQLTVLIVLLIAWAAQLGDLVLLQDLLAPAVQMLLPSIFGSFAPHIMRRITVGAAAVLLAPMCYKGTLSEARFLCYASVGSVLLMTAIVGVRAVQSFGLEHPVDIHFVDRKPETHHILTQVKLMPDTVSDAVAAFPLVALSFVCHFNVLPLHQELRRPTRHRMRRVLAVCMVLGVSLYIFLGISGYVFAGEYTCGNILQNFIADDPLVAVARGALGLVLMLNGPLLVHPARNSLFRFMVECGYRPGGVAAVEAEESPSKAARDLLKVDSAGAMVHAYRRTDLASGVVSRGHAVPPADIFQPKDTSGQQAAVEPTIIQRHLATTAVLVSSVLTSVFMPGVLQVWSVLGSTVGFLVAFLLPFAFWHRLVGPSTVVRRCAVAVLLPVLVATMIYCSYLSVQSLSAPPCPLPERKAVDPLAGGHFADFVVAH